MAKLKYNESARHWAHSNEIVRTKAIRVGLKIVKMREGRRNKVKLLETLQNRSCDGCKWNYTIENRDMDTNERLDDLMPKACYMCCNAHQLQWEAKE